MKALRLLSIAEVAEMTGVPENTLRHYRYIGKGPKAGKLGGRVVYREEDVRAWIDAAFEGGDAA